MSRRTRIPLVATGIVLVFVVVFLVPLVLDGGALDHDESAYALKARHWIEDTPETGWNLHRGIAMSAYGYVVFEAGGQEGALRLIGLVALVGFASATWMLGRRIGGKWVGSVSAIALMSSPFLLRRSTEFLSDVPASALLMAVMIIIWGQFGAKERPGFGLMWMLPFAWAAFYLRYQSVLSLGLIAVTVVVLFWDEVVAGWRPVLLTSLVGVVGLLPHFLYAISETGTALGIISFTAEIAGRRFIGEGLVDYFLLMGWPLAGFVGPFAVVFFVWWLVAGRRSASQRSRCLFLMIPSAGQVLVLGLLSHGEARFIFFPLALTLIGGATGFWYLRRGWRPIVYRATSTVLAVLLFASLVSAAIYVRSAVERREAGAELIQEAAGAIAGLSTGASCGVMTSYSPQLTYYSGCYSGFFRTDKEAARALSRVEGDDRFMLIVQDGKNQPEGTVLDDLVGLTTGDPLVVEAGGKTALIYEFAS